jgi:hypothetical protein
MGFWYVAIANTKKCTSHGGKILELSYFLQRHIKKMHMMYLNYTEIIEITENQIILELGESGIGNTVMDDDADLGALRDSRYWTIGYATTIY